MVRFLLVCLGGAAGTGARYLLTIGALRALGPAFPYGTLAVNLIGSFCIGLLMRLSATTAWITPTLRWTLTTGLLGGFTTYSSFNYETLESFRAGALGMGLLNISVTLLGCLLAGMLGLACARALIP